ncbi:MAG: hypothetical protein ASARMPRED_007875 [Alectoria sarmentosa]|nr:MAG: hypothetical protein ASARMPRED_007875 [Alectoria sarmentosa]
MGTRGFRIIKFKGRYWIFYNHWDSYPDGLGDWLVETIPEDPEEYQKWLQSQRDFFGKWDSILQRILTIQPEDMYKLNLDEPQMHIIHATLDERLQGDAPSCYQSEFNDTWIEWIYTINLDREIFSVNNGAHFHLNQIPADWSEALFTDDKGHTFLLPQLVPTESIGTLALDPSGFVPSNEYEKLQTRLVKPNISPSHVIGPRLRWMLFNSFQETMQADLSVSLLDWQVQDLSFRELAFFILCLAAGGENFSLIDHRRVKKPYDNAAYLGMTTSDLSESEAGMELATCLGVGYHMDGLPMGSAPGETKYWLEGALVCLARHLDNPGILTKAIADVIEYGRNSAGTSFNAVLISIEHVVLIKSLPDGSVDHTELLCLIPITTHYSKDARARYGDQALDSFYDAKFPGKNEEADGESEDDVDDESEDEVDNESEDEVKLIVPKNPVTEALIKQSFMGLVQFFEATILETLRPTQLNEARLPEEICQMVLRNVSDTKTYNSCLKVSRRFRLMCQQRPLVMDNVVFLEPLPRDQASLLIKEKVEKSNPQPWRRRNNRVKGPQPLPDFLATELSSARHMDVWFNSGDGNSDGLTCLMVAGCELNRKSFAGHNVRFQGLCVPIPPEADEVGKRKMRAATQPNRGMTSAQERDEKPEDDLWECAIKNYKIDTDSNTDMLGGFWKDMTQELDHPIKEPSGPAWLLPPNTVCYGATKESFRSKGGANDMESETGIGFRSTKSFCYLYLRLKRASKYWDEQWNDIIRETTKHLNSTDNEKAYFQKCPVEVFGADEPYVILTVGLEVRLFKWDQGFDETVDEGARRKMSPRSALRELSPGKVLNPCEERKDREEIERFLVLAGRHREAIKARVERECGEEREW